jgi:hypothetical protein
MDILGLSSKRFGGVNSEEVILCTEESSRPKVAG